MFKRWSYKLELLFMAVTFAEAGEADFARLLVERSQRQPDE